MRNEGRYRRDRIIILRMFGNAFYYELFNVQPQIRVSQKSKQSINRNFYSTIYVGLFKVQVYYICQREMTNCKYRSNF